ncbi:hypothetical protein ATK36_1228 [Amycolatopsis sulphurea]|uniref:Uncharacterized protein n=1 Tax=Amycolatopsis sulphurea TaxID=76022 RepID=A0A2A9G3A0_9PSEU|nr:hypothetical protein [Amycolatopsis sulphurea]PFG57633.1 hypothetical protein ATK36_1228 [Amycolatopsis sulphurea]
MSGERPSRPAPQTCNPWTIVDLVFQYLADQGLRPVLGETGNPGEPAAQLLCVLGIVPEKQGDQRARDAAKEELARLRTTLLDEPGDVPD